jgi:hypothetical protein
MSKSQDYFNFLHSLENDPNFCYNYLEKNSFNKKHPTYEQCLKTISKDAKVALRTAEKIIKGRFELAEPTISNDAHSAYWYAKDVIKGKWEAGEPGIAGDSKYSFDYASNVLRGRFILGEPSIAKDEYLSYKYATEIVMGKLPEEMHNIMLARKIAS